MDNQRTLEKLAIGVTGLVAGAGIFVSAVESPTLNFLARAGIELCELLVS